MAKRSPILGYNHNVRYRGLVFHVQTEDSGVLSPHLFTHLFHAGVIVSTRKLVYDAGSAEDAIKSLMQAQHKAVMKDLRRGLFDDKIDQYLGDTPGLLPRGAAGEGQTERTSEPELARPSEPIEPALARPSEPQIHVVPEPTSAPAAAGLQAISELTLDSPADPELLGGTDALPVRHQTTIPDVRGAAPPVAARTKTAERRSPPSQVRTSLPATLPDPLPDATVPVASPRGLGHALEIDLDPATELDRGALAGLSDVAAAINAANSATIRTQAVAEANLLDEDSSPSIEIQLELDEPEEPLASQPVSGGRRRAARDTDISSPNLPLSPEPYDPRASTSDGVPASFSTSSTLPPPPAASTRSALGAATLPPARPVTRPPTSRPAMGPPQVVTRPLSEGSRKRADSDAVEVYAPAPPSVEPPPGAQAERPGQYSYKRPTGKVPTEIAARAEREIAARAERSGAVPVPPGLGRPGARQSSGPVPQRTRDASSNPHGTGSGSARPTPGSGPNRPGSGPARPTPVRPESTLPVGSRPAGLARPTPSAGSIPSRPATNVPARPTPSAQTPNAGVVMTRPAVIVGAPAKPAPPRVRKAREDEGRGFGQGLISEKSLDEVILAYLSEDAEDK